MFIFFFCLGIWTVIQTEFQSSSGCDKYSFILLKNWKCMPNGVIYFVYGPRNTVRMKKKIERKNALSSK